MKRNLQIKFLFIGFIFISSNAFGVDESIFEGMTSIEAPFERRDPFRAPKITIQRKSDVKGRISDGNYSNIPTLGEVSISQIQVVGVIIGKERRAFVRIGNSSNAGEEGGAPTGVTYTLKEGQILGENEAELKAILPGGLILVEKTTNIYGQEEYLETVIPISK